MKIRHLKFRNLFPRKVVTWWHIMWYRYHLNLVGIYYALYRGEKGTTKRINVHHMAGVLYHGMKYRALDPKGLNQYCRAVVKKTLGIDLPANF